MKGDQKMGQLRPLYQYAEFKSSSFLHIVDLAKGPNPDAIFCMLDNRYLNGFINNVEVLGAYMIDNRDNSEFEAMCDRIDKLINEESREVTNVSNVNEYDDIIILGKSDDLYHIFWADHDEHVESDYHRAMYGRISKRHFKSDEDALESLRKWVDDIQGDGKSKYIPDKFFKGVIVL